VCEREHGFADMCMGEFVFVFDMCVYESCSHRDGMFLFVNQIAMLADGERQVGRLRMHISSRLVTIEILLHENTQVP